MTTVAVFGATGYSGGNIGAEALARGHRVIAVARDVRSLQDRTDLDVRAGSVFDQSFVRSVASEADVIAICVAANGTGLADNIPALGAIAAETATRLGVVGGAGSLRVSPEGPRVVDTAEFPEQVKPEALAHAEVLARMRELPKTVDWFYLSPAGGYGRRNAGERTGDFRLSDEVLVTDAEGNSNISGADYAIAFVDEIDRPAHPRARFTVGY